MIKLKKLNETYARVECESDIAYELSEAFTFEVPGAKFSPMYKKGVWDGRIKLFSLAKRTLPFGLVSEVQKFCRERNYECVLDENLKTVTDITREEVLDFVKTLGLDKRSKPIEVRDYQIEGVYTALKHKRGILLSATGCMDPQTEIEVELDSDSMTELLKIRERSSSSMKISLLELEHLVKNKFYPKINTPSGLEIITDVYRKSTAGVHLTFDDNTEMKASVLHLVWNNNSWVYISEFEIGDEISSKRVTSKTYLDEQEWIDFSIDAEHESYFHNGILHHNSGKSLILGVISRYLTEVLNVRVLIIVPTIGLTTQMKNDFDDYFGHTGWSAEDNVHLISSGADKSVKKPIVISTFQSIYKMDSDWINQFGCIVGDEGHKIVAKTITGIYERGTEVEYKLACTGTLQDMKCNILAMRGITGDVFDIASTSKLIEAGQLVPLDIKALILNHSSEVCLAMKKADYETEIKYLTTLEKRNKFIANLALTCKGTTLVLFRYVDAQGIPLYDLISDKSKDRNVHYIDGSVKGSERELIRNAANHSDDIIVASYSTFATGTNLPAIENVIFAHPFKSKITGLQSIGRGLRLKEGKTKCTLYDISDNMSYKKSPNTTFLHLSERLKYYTQSGFQFKITNIQFF